MIEGVDRSRHLLQAVAGPRGRPARKEDDERRRIRSAAVQTSRPPRLQSSLFSITQNWTASLWADDSIVLRSSGGSTLKLGVEFEAVLLSLAYKDICAVKAVRESALDGYTIDLCMVDRTKEVDKLKVR